MEYDDYSDDNVVKTVTIAYHLKNYIDKKKRSRRAVKNINDSKNINKIVRQIIIISSNNNSNNNNNFDDYDNYVYINNESDRINKIVKQVEYADYNNLNNINSISTMTTRNDNINNLRVKKSSDYSYHYEDQDTDYHNYKTHDYDSSYDFPKHDYDTYKRDYDSHKRDYDSHKRDFFYCYQCAYDSSDVNENECLDPIDRELVRKTKCQTNCTIITDESADIYRLTRTCSNNCKPFTSRNHNVTCCTDDYCNAAVDLATKNSFSSILVTFLGCLLTIFRESRHSADRSLKVAAIFDYLSKIRYISILPMFNKQSYDGYVDTDST
ncbi:hypothetical protein HELRODRAFT_181609 [Helobdella robusta]|uniref:UPAR/Ly6 domain-containing protein n=1 Tax=Helobdella robusta TaxID=6412 RepID=T1FH61_HELRO|nr:hypothetical protein HELRODRAFT_181609 [Helobdella robusta]ESN92271.1 hypothetical protein HELRODRAFT_181609 [Helobdella robusta]